VTFVESDRRAQALVAENLARCGIEEGYAIIRASAGRALEMLRGSPSFVPFDIILLDPPYDHPVAVALNGLDGLLAPGGLVVIEHARRSEAPDAAGRLTRTRDLVSGDSALAFYACQP
jgi:16S rRNA G966 N2-methylase RsmD